MRSFLLIGTFLLGSLAVSAQEGYRVITASNPKSLPVDTPAKDTSMTVRPGEVTFNVPPRIEALLKDYTTHKHTLNGYRVQIFLGDRTTAESTKRSFLQKYPETPAYLSWLAPNFRLRVGNLRTRLEADRMLRDMKLAYPGSYIVPDEIEMPRIP